jgi:membrane protein
MWEAFQTSLSWPDLLKRTIRESNADDCLGLAAQLAYYFFLALFPAILFVFAIASFFPVTDVVGKGVNLLGPFLPPEVLRFLTEQLTRVANADSGGILTLGILGAVWSSSAALVSVISALNRAYDIEEARPWWKVRLVATSLTLALALFVLLAFSLIVVGPTVADYLGNTLGFGPVFAWTWKILQWPLAFFLVSTAFGLVYYFAPDADQDWVWITPGAVLGTVLWLVVSLGFKLYTSNFTDYNETYGTVGGVIVLMLWFYLSGLAILVGAELNAEIEHASPHGKASGEKVPGQRRKIGVAAAREYRERLAGRAAGPAAEERARPAARVTTAYEEAPMTRHDDRSLGQLVTELSTEIGTLVRQEMRLAQTELSDKVTQVKTGAAVVTGGVLLAYAGLLAIVSAVVLGLVALGMPAWAAAAVGGLLVAGAGYVLVRTGLASLNPADLIPRQTIDSVKEDVPWLNSQTK